MSANLTPPGRNVLLVWSDYSEMGARLPYLYHRAGLQVDVLGVSRGLMTLSRHIRRSIPCGEGAVLDTLEAHLADPANAYDWVVPADDATLYALVGDESRDWSRILPADFHTGRAHLIASKSLFTLECQKRGIPMPPSVVCGRPEEAHAAAARLGYPVMVKSDRGCAGFGVRKAEGADALAAALAELGGETWVIQRFIRGRVGTTEMLMEHGKPVCWLVSTKDTVWPAPFGPSCVRELLEHPDMLTRIEQVGEMTGFHGLCGVDWMVDEGGTLSLLELNARPMPGYHLGVFAGVDFAAALRQMAGGGPVTPQSPRPLGPGRPLIYLWPQYGLRCLGVGSPAGLTRFLPGVARTDLLLGEPRLIFYNAVRLGWGLARYLTRQALSRVGILPPVAART